MANYTNSGDYVDNYTAPPVRIDLSRKEPVEDASSLSDLNPSTEVNTETSINEISEKKVKKVEVVQGVSFDPKTAQPFDPTTIIPRKEKKSVDNTQNTLMSALDMAVIREKESITERHKELEAKMYEDYLEQEEARDEAAKETQISKSRDEDLDDDFDDLDTTVSYSGDSGESIEKSFNIPDETTSGDTSGGKPVQDSESNGEEKEPVKIIRSVADYDEIEFEKDFASDDDDDEEDDLDEKPKSTPEDRRERERKEAEKLVNGIRDAAKEEFTDAMFNRINLREFSISKQPIKASKVIIDQEQASIADWVLYETEKCISMSGLSGPELIQLDPRNSTRNRVNTLIDIYKIIYNHVIDDKKPSFEKWMMQTKYNDLDHIYFCLYKATFGANNYLSYQCTDPDCEHIFMVKTAFEDMIKYKDDTVKEKVKEIMAKDTNNGIIKYSVDLVQVSNKYVFGMRSPSLYNVAMENAGLSDSILDKYGDMINVINYIDSAYTIDYANKTLIPIDIPTPKDKNPVKAASKKIKVLYRILKCLSSDEYYALRSYAIKCDRKAGEDITYFVPEATCPKCGRKIDAVTEDMNANALLFTRHQLGAFANM